MFKSVVWTSMLDYPGRICTVLFVGSCNWKCSFCHNNRLFDLPDIDFNSDIFPKLLERKSLINTIVISGGEPSVYADDVEKVVEKLVENGFVVGIHTNGSNSGFISRLSSKISYWGMDIKTSPQKYNRLGFGSFSTIETSIQAIIASGSEYEFRTTMHPDTVSIDDAVEIAKMLAKYTASNYVIQQFRPDNDEPVYIKNVLEDAVDICSVHIWTELRGVN